MNTLGTCYLKYGEVPDQATNGLPNSACGFLMARAAELPPLQDHQVQSTSSPIPWHIIGPVIGVVVVVVAAAAFGVFMMLRRRRRRAAADTEVVWGARTYPMPRPPAGDPPDPFLTVPSNPPEAEPGEHREVQ